MTTTKESPWAEIRSEYMDDENIIHIDAWTSGNENEEGHVIAYVILDYKRRVQVIHADPRTRWDAYALEVIAEAKKELLEVVAEEEKEEKK